MQGPSVAGGRSRAARGLPTFHLVLLSALYLITCSFCSALRQESWIGWLGVSTWQDAFQRDSRLCGRKGEGRKPLPQDPLPQNVRPWEEPRVRAVSSPSTHGPRGTNREPVPDVEADACGNGRALVWAAGSGRAVWWAPRPGERLGWSPGVLFFVCPGAVPEARMRQWERQEEASSRYKDHPQSPGGTGGGLSVGKQAIRAQREVSVSAPSDRNPV